MDTNFRPDNQMIKPEQKKEIPIGWFSGIGGKTAGVTNVSFSPKFVQTFGVKFVKDLLDYEDVVDHHNGHNRKGIFKSMEEGEEKQKIIKKGERIKEITGFSFEELNAERTRLEKLYKGKTEELPKNFDLF